MAKPRLFIVDDDEDMLRSLALVLSRTYQVLTCNDAERSVGMIKDFSPDCLVLDIRMPGHDGFWIYEQVRGFDANVPIIFNSAYQDFIAPEDITSAYSPFAYLTKTGDLPRFLQVVSEAVAASRAPRDATRA